MKLFRKSYDGGPDSGVTGYWVIEWKEVFSIVLLHFSPGSRDAFHSHAFNALTWWLRGAVVEEFAPDESGSAPTSKAWQPSLKPKFTPRHNFHKIIAGPAGAWALSIRGPWAKTWKEAKHGSTHTLTHGRVRLGE